MAILNTGTLLLITFFGCTMGTLPPENKIQGYDLSRPDRTITLPDTLREISGIASLDAQTCACIQDENGILFIYDLAKQEIKEQYTFGGDGDYEGMAKTGEAIFVMRSDATLYEIRDYASSKPKIATYSTQAPAEDCEGLCYDKDHQRLLIGVKGKAGKSKEDKDQRLVFGFDLTKKALMAEPVFNFSVETMRRFASANHIELPIKIKKDGEQGKPVLKFKTSAMAVHPVTKKLFLLSADDYLLFVFDKDGKIENMVQLNPALFNKAEGITFAENGDMLISNEAQDKKATILEFKYNGSR